MTGAYEDEEAELEPGEAERMGGLLLLGLLLADLIAHPRGADELTSLMNDHHLG